MIGLFLKDLFNLRQYGKTLIFVLVFFALLSSGMDNPAVFFEGLIILLSTMAAITSFSYDAMAKWDRYALSMPVKRSDVVGSKYLLSLLLCLGTAVFSFLVSIVVLKVSPVEGFGLKDNLLVIGGIICAVLTVSGIILPLIIKFGVEKSRIFMLALFATPTAAVVALDNAGVSMPSGEFPALLLPLLAVLIYFLSFLLSVRIYRSKEI